MRLPVEVTNTLKNISNSIYSFAKASSSSFNQFSDDEYYSVERNIQDYGIPVDDYTLMKAYTAVESMYSAVTSIAREGANVPLKIWMYSEKNIKEECADHPANKLLDSPNNLFTRFEFIESIIAFPLITGSCFIYKDKTLGTEKNPVRKLNVLRPDTVTVNPIDREGNVRFVRPEDKKSFPQESIIHIKRFNPFTPFKGLAATLPTSGSMTLEVYLNQYAKSFFQNAVVPSMIFSTERGINEVSFERFKVELRQYFQGAGKAHNPMVLYHGLKPIEHSQTTPVKGGYPDVSEIIRDKIYMNIGAYDLRAIANNISGEGLKEAVRMFWYKTMLPVLKQTQQALTIGLLSEYKDHPNCFFEFDTRKIPALREDFRDESLGIMRLIQSQVLGVKEARVMLGHPREMADDDTTGILNPFGNSMSQPPTSNIVSNEERNLLEQQTK